MTTDQTAPSCGACSSCHLQDLCLPVGLSPTEIARLDTLVAARRNVPRGCTLFRQGDRFEAFYAVRTGFFKTRVLSPDGREQSTGVEMAGESLGLDGICTGSHGCDAVALEDSQVCVIAYADLERLSRDFVELQRRLHKLMSGEVLHDHAVMLLLGGMRAEARVASFLLNLARRLQARGFSSSSLVLRMTREEIGTYLAVRLETVSRCLSRFQADGVLSVKDRQISILDPQALRRLAGEVQEDTPNTRPAQQRAASLP